MISIGVEKPVEENSFRAIVAAFLNVGLLMLTNYRSIRCADVGQRVELEENS